MSAGYATKLSFRDDLGGQLGDAELSESTDALSEKVTKLSDWVAASKSIVVFTGAGISTACGIPDFRGPAGIWTLQRAGKPIPEFKVTFGLAKPSLTHQALLALLQEGKLRYVVSQNVDSLHLRSGIPRHQLAELHGNCFAERCPKCKSEYIRDFEMETVGFKYTGRRCAQADCNGRLKDHVLDWEDALPKEELKASEQAAAQADLAICLGTSLQITPACNIPLKTVKAGGKLVIINLQKTPKDKKANLVIHAKCDEVMQQVMARLRIPVPAYTRTDTLIVSHTVKAAKPKPDGSSMVSCTVAVQSSHGPSCPMPLVQEVEISFQGLPARPAVLRRQPFSVSRTFGVPAAIEALVSLRLTPGLDICQHTISHSIKVDEDSKLPEVHTVTHQLTTQQQTYMPPKQADTAGALAAGLAVTTDVESDLPCSKRVKL